MFYIPETGTAIGVVPGFSDQVVVQHITQDGRMLLKIPPGVEAENPLMEPVIDVAGACSWCKKYFPSNKLLYCASCKTGGPYCGRVCQRQAWKAKHKKECKKRNEPKKANSVERATLKVLQQLFAYADKKFIYHSMGLLSISDTARMYFRDEGPGVLILHLEDDRDLEQFMMEIQSVVIGDLNPSFNGIQLPSVVYVEHPLKDRASYSAENGNYATLTDVEDRLRALDIDSIMENLTMSQYVLGITVGNNPELHLLTFEQNTTGIPKPKSLVSAASRSKTFEIKLTTSPAFAKCREQMVKMNTKPGVLWIRNVYSHEKNDFHRSELEKVTPDVLLKDLIQHQVDIATKAETFSCACRYVYEDGTGAAADDFCGELPPWWDSFLETNREKILDPNTLIGFFEVGSFSNSEMSANYVFSFKH